VKQLEALLGRSLAESTDTLISDLDAVDYLATATERGAELLGGARIGVLVADPGGMLTAVAAAPDRKRMIDLLELQNQGGPALTCYRDCEQVVNAQLNDRAHNAWPAFAPRASREGVCTVHAFPLCADAAAIGVLCILDPRSHDLDRRELGLAQSLAGLATRGILAQRRTRHPSHIADQLRASLEERKTIDQAKGFVAERLTVDVDTAFALMRAYTRKTAVRLGDLAFAIVGARLAPEELRGRGAA